MFGILSGIAKVATKTVIGIPLAVAADVITLGGTLNNKRGSHTGDMINGISETIEEIADE